MITYVSENDRVVKLSREYLDLESIIVWISRHFLQISLSLYRCLSLFFSLSFSFFKFSLQINISNHYYYNNARGAQGIMVIVVGNGHCDLSPNPGLFNSSIATCKEERKLLSHLVRDGRVG